ncbi:glycerol-3-phosphate-binding periplasmic protein precursor [Legionella quinlivanii]|uniref:sn-glycerol-3-phosphate-binding periplasmic protein UgpB n=1 Tax=Legionella quinlivanii TaxID=45073 RepID=A0A0W0XP37_9GAMM|nr:extracellular solute-binding protein [Legionella quinlivanii]KTD46098.1 glycerol-3-phosphate-binding periplasmic protein precursor [Legionella quinlivanii]SEG28706.1 carbohydrate ABC transporter substrate-binding protein, CUT1 family (TC 3.A.1.1.-) [Legionella quinlivanii DSM 21216]STY10595.1 glycerol-3-phosphate-binding periplasmic protein precursor [Legionella quinlivanii]
MKTLLFLTLFYLIGGSVWAEPVEIIFWHSMAGHLGEEVESMVQAFNQSQSDYQIKPVYKGEYTDSLTSFAAAFRAHKPPAIVQVFEVGTATMLSPAGIHKPLEELMREQQIDFPLQDFLPSVRTFYSEKGELQAMPFNTSIPVLYYNSDLLATIGISQANFPKTWEELENMLEQLKQKGQICGYTSAYPAWVSIESFSALHGLALTDGTKENAIYNNPAVLNHLKRLQRWQRLNYFEYGGRASDATALFTSGRCALFSQSSGAYNSLANMLTFSLGVARLPIDSKVSTERHTNVAGGAALWSVAGQSPEVYRGTALFFAFIAKPERQKQWHLNTGYIPLGLSGVYAGIARESHHPILALAEDELAKPQSVYMKHYDGPQNQIRTANDEALESIFAGLKTPEKALSDAVNRANYLLLRHQRNAG